MLAFRDAGHGAVVIASSSTPVTLENYIFARFKSAIVKLNADLKRGDEVCVKCGALEGLRGILITNWELNPGAAIKNCQLPSLR
jgi:hypothetical protein